MTPDEASPKMDPIKQTLQIAVFMLRIREGLRSSSSSPCKCSPHGQMVFVCPSGKTFSALDPTNICASRNNLQDMVNQEDG